MLSYDPANKPVAATPRATSRMDSDSIHSAPAFSNDRSSVIRSSGSNTLEEKLLIEGVVDGVMGTARRGVVVRTSFGNFRRLTRGFPVRLE